MSRLRERLDRSMSTLFHVADMLQAFGRRESRKEGVFV